MTLFSIIVACVAGGIASCAVAAIALWAKLQSIERWVAFAVGAMLTVVFWTSCRMRSPTARCRVR
jgi:Ni,Fe-hydrogenase I cytochrome b subunit